MPQQPQQASGHQTSQGSQHQQQHQQHQQQQHQHQLPSDLLQSQRPDFDVLEWYGGYESCQKFFVDHAQHTFESGALAAMLNIQLPHQWPQHPVPYLVDAKRGSKSNVSLHPYVRRLVATGFDTEAVMHGLFGDDWRKGVGPLQECERRNYLFAAKSTNWTAVKAQYDMDRDQTIPFLRPPRLMAAIELEGADKGWSDWLYMQDWMVGSRAPSSEPDVAARRSSQMTD